MPLGYEFKIFRAMGCQVGKKNGHHLGMCTLIFSVMDTIFSHMGII